MRRAAQLAKIIVNYHLARGTCRRVMKLLLNLRHVLVEGVEKFITKSVCTSNT